MKSPKAYLGNSGKWLPSFVVFEGADGKQERAPFLTFEEDEYSPEQQRQIRTAREAAEADPISRWYLNHQWMDAHRGRRLLNLECLECRRPGERGRRVGAVYDTERGPLLTDVTILRSREARSILAEGVEAITRTTPLLAAPIGVPPPLTGCPRHGLIPLSLDELRAEASLARRKGTCRTVVLNAKAARERYASALEAGAMTHDSSSPSGGSTAD